MAIITKHPQIHELRNAVTTLLFMDETNQPEFLLIMKLFLFTCEVYVQCVQVAGFRILNHTNLNQIKGLWHEIFEKLFFEKCGK